MAGEALGLVVSNATLTSGKMPMGSTASVESVLQQSWWMLDSLVPMNGFGTTALGLSGLGGMAV